MILLLTILYIVFSCAACGGQEEANCVFYYLRSDSTIQYGQTDALIAPVEREFSVQEVPLNDLLQLYLDGPTDEAFRRPFPKGTYLLSTISKDEVLVVVLSREFSTMDSIQLSLAGACLTATCHDLTGCQAIQVRSGENVYDFNLNDFVFLDEIAGK
jgi:germination protein M